MKKPETKEAMLSLLKSKVAINPETNCWLWLGHETGGNGYGGISIAEGNRVYKKWRVHRLMWETHNGPISNGLLVLHSCHNRRCINIEHLRLGTYKDNYEDARKAGRNTKGEIQGHAKLTESKVREIREMRVAGIGQRTVAKIFGIGRSTVRHIERWENWRHVV